MYMEALFSVSKRADPETLRQGSHLLCLTFPSALFCFLTIP